MRIRLNLQYQKAMLSLFLVLYYSLSNIPCYNLFFTGALEHQEECKTISERKRPVLLEEAILF